MYACFTGIYLEQNSLYVIWKGFEIVVASLIVVNLLSCPEPNRFARKPYELSVFIFCILLVVYWIEAAIFPSEIFAPQTGFKGAFGFTMQGYIPVKNPNSMGFLAAIVSFAMMCAFTRPARISKKTIYLSLLILSLGMLILAQARTSLAGFVLAAGAFLVLERRYKTLIAGGFVCGILFFFTQLTENVGAYITRGQPESHIEALSGRIYGWQAALSNFWEAPLLGHGFVAFSRTEIGSGGNLHGSVFEVLVGVGLLGALPWVSAILWTGISVLRLPKLRRYGAIDNLRRSYDAEITGVFIIVASRGVTSSTLAEHGGELMLLLSVIVYVCAKRYAAKDDMLSRQKESLRAQHMKKQYFVS